MTLRRTLPRVAGSLAALAVVASIPAWSLVGTSDRPSGGERADPVVPSFFEAVAETPSPTPDPTEDAVDTAEGSSAGAASGDDTLIEVSGAPFWVGPEGSRAEVVATVTAYRAARGLPAFVPYESVDSSSCTPAAHGSAAAGGFERTSATLGQRLVARSPDAVGFHAAAGYVAVAFFVVDELIVDGVVYPNRATQLLVSQCLSASGSPEVIPSSPPAPDPVPSESAPPDPAPPAETPPADPPVPDPVESEPAGG